jgi:hypothetical protein
MRIFPERISEEILTLKINKDKLRVRIKKSKPPLKEKTL